MISHANIMGLCAGNTNIFDWLNLEEEQVWMAYLPLAHIMEFAAEAVAYFMGLTVAYGRIVIRLSLNGRSRYK
jgi:long-chain acyl-CoA synthetase